MSSLQEVWGWQFELSHSSTDWGQPVQVLPHCCQWGSCCPAETNGCGGQRSNRPEAASDGMSQSWDGGFCSLWNTQNLFFLVFVRCLSAAVYLKSAVFVLKSQNSGEIPACGLSSGNLISVRLLKGGSELIGATFWIVRMVSVSQQTWDLRPESL